MFDTEKSHLLQKLDLFMDISNDELRWIVHKTKVREYYPNEVVVWQGNPSDTVYIIKEGIASVKKIIPGKEEEVKLVYLFPGNTFGEIGILVNSPRAANVVAVTDLECLVIRKQDFIDILKKHPTVGIKLSTLLARRLRELDKKVSFHNRKIRLILLFASAKECGGTTLAHAIAGYLASKTDQKTVYTEYPSAYKLISDFEINDNVSIFPHPTGYDIYISDKDFSPPSSSQASLLIDKLITEYDNIVIGLPCIIDNNMAALFEYANQIILVGLPQDESIEKLNALNTQLKQYINPHTCTLLTIENCNKQEFIETSSPEQYNFTIPYLNLPNNFLQRNLQDTSFPDDLFSLASTLIDRLDRTHQIKIFIPTTMDVNSSIDTSQYVERTLQFLGDKFGGATSTEASGVWKSNEVGLVGETVYIVSSYSTEEDMNFHLDSVIDYVKGIGMELSQEAMALEVDRKLILL